MRSPQSSLRLAQFLLFLTCHKLPSALPVYFRACFSVFRRPPLVSPLKYSYLITVDLARDRNYSPAFVRFLVRDFCSFQQLPYMWAVCRRYKPTVVNRIKTKMRFLFCSFVRHEFVVLSSNYPASVLYFFLTDSRTASCSSSSVINSVKFL